MTAQSQKWSARGPVISGLVTLALLIGGFGGWSVLTDISGAIVAPVSLRSSRTARSSSIPMAAWWPKSRWSRRRRSRPVIC